MTLSLNPDFKGGALSLWVLAGVQMPIDDFLYYVDGNLAGALTGATEWESISISLEAGAHEVLFSYSYNPLDLIFLPPGGLDHLGAVYIDDVSIVPFSESFFDGFESGVLSTLDWSIDGVEGWNVDTTRPFEGSFSAHVRTDDIPLATMSSQLDLELFLQEVAFFSFYYYAPVSMPFESLELWIDGTFMEPLTTEDETWRQGGTFLAVGQHTVSWKYSKNPSNAASDVIEQVPPPPYRLGEAWLDNVELLGMTSSFTEDWESGDFDSRPWITSGDASWTITDSKAFNGTTYSATAITEDISSSTGNADLSLEIVSENGGDVSFQILPSVQAPFEMFNVMINGNTVKTFQSVEEDWISSSVTISAGKQLLTFNLAKNPGSVPDSAIEIVPITTGRLGQVWLDDIQFSFSS